MPPLPLLPTFPLQACLHQPGNAHATMGIALAVDIPLDGEQTITVTPLPKLPSGSEGVLAEFATLLGEEDLALHTYILAECILGVPLGFAF